MTYAEDILKEADQTKLTYVIAQRQCARAQWKCNIKSQLYHKFALYKKGDKNGKLLALLAREDYSRPAIHAINKNETELITNPIEINQNLAEYYQNLYTTKLEKTPSEIANYLQNLDLPNLSLEHRTFLDSPIQEQETLEAIAALPQGKTPGPDGIPNMWYLNYATLLIITDVFGPLRH
ncbi:hypothetical protein XELAEV_18000167mg [Xenopus laevis]|uniref:Uncharacterized protein n=1 Tax=Xenopus laevis TaxID=8355 RepID=A0A974GZB1_XENLA|nr:hypothetical protein XELAEV_18000167mg [Xenopus laevis]